MALPLHAEFRTWSNPSGITLNAELVKVDGENVTLRLSNGKLTTFSQTKLSEVDRQFIKDNPPAASHPHVPANRKAVWLTKLDKAQEESKQTGLPILILFTAVSWCEYSALLEEEVLSQKEFKTFANQNLVLLLLDSGPKDSKKTKEHEALMEQYAVSVVPTYFLTDGSGAKLAMGGYDEGMTAKNFTDWVKESLPVKK